jgi:hypothetical protein
MYTRSTTRVRTVANRPVFHTSVAPYTSSELDELTAQLEALDAIAASAPRTVAREQWQQLALDCCELTEQLEAIRETLARIEARVTPAHLARPSRAQRRVLLRLVRVGPLDPRDDDDAAWCDAQVLRAMQRRRWVECNMFGEWRVTAYGEQALARLEARERDAARVQLTLIRGGAL